MRAVVTQLIVMRNLPFTAVEWLELRALLLAVNPESGDVLHTSALLVLNLIEGSYVADKEVIRGKLAKAQSLVHLAVDVWSSLNRKNFLAIVGHFVDYSFKQRKALLGLPLLPAKHGADD